MSEPEVVVKKSAEQRTQEAILDTLAELSGKRVGEDSIIREGTKFILPETIDIPTAIQHLVHYQESMDAPTSFSKKFRYRPWDGAACFQSALMRTWGTAGSGVTLHSFFGSQLPELRTIDNGPDSQIQVPWGIVQFAPLSAQIGFDSVNDRDYGPLFVMHVTAPKKYAPQVDGLFKLVENELKTNSIYKGKAFTGAEEPAFFDPYAVDREKVVYSDEVETQLGALIWATILYTEACKDWDISLKRSTLLTGPYGTGKSLGGQLTAQYCIENGWTFLLCRPGRDDLEKVLQMARLYQPAIVFFEDLDTIETTTGKPQDISKVQDLFDGITAKGTALGMVHTTNFVERIGAGMLRPGRLDGVIDIGPLDAEGFIRLVKASVPRKYLPSERKQIEHPGVVDVQLPAEPEAINWPQVAAAMEGFLPAFVKEAVERAKLYAIWRTHGKVKKLSTEDLVHAAKGLRPQLEMMHAAKAGISPDRLEEAMSRVVQKVITSGDVIALDEDGDRAFILAQNNAK